MNRFNKLANTALLSILCLLLLTPNISKTFNGHHEYNNVFYSIIARNYVEHGLVKTKAAQFVNAQKMEEPTGSIHTHHPAILPILVALSFSILGITESAARLVPILASIISIVGIYFVVLKSTRSKISAFGTACLIMTTPLFLYYGKVVVFESVLLPFIIWGTYIYYKNQNKKMDYLSPFLVFMAFSIDWPGFWFGLWILLAEMLTNRRKKVILSLVAALGLAGIIIIGHIWIVTDNPIEKLMRAWTLRSTTQNEPYTYIEWTKLLIQRYKAFYGLPIIILSSIGFMYSLITKKFRTLSLALLATGLSHILVFRVITWYHDYMLYHMIPFVIFTVGIGLSRIKTIKTQTVTIVLLILISFSTTNRFYSDLSTMTPHQECVDFANKLSQSDKPMTFYGSQQKQDSCFYFIGFYERQKYSTIQVN